MSLQPLPEQIMKRLTPELLKLTRELNAQDVKLGNTSVSFKHQGCEVSITVKSKPEKK